MENEVDLFEKDCSKELEEALSDVSSELFESSNGLFKDEAQCREMVDKLVEKETQKNIKMLESLFRMVVNI